MFAYLPYRGAQLTTAARPRRVIAALAVVTCGLLGWAGAVPAASAAIISIPDGSYGPAPATPGGTVQVITASGMDAPQDSGLVACRYPWSTQDVPATEYPKLRAQFAGSRWPDLRNAGTAYVDLATHLLNAPYTDGYETVWFYQRLSAACAKRGQ